MEERETCERDGSEHAEQQGAAGEQGQAKETPKLEGAAKPVEGAGDRRDGDEPAVEDVAARHPWMADPFAHLRHRPEPAPPERICCRCVFLIWPQRLEGTTRRQMVFPVCAHHYDRPGTLREVHPLGCCRNFRARKRLPRRPEVPEPPNENVRYIALTKHQLTVVDAHNYEWLSKHRWFVKGGADGKYYAGRSERGKIILMHTEIMKPPPGMVTDHMNGNSLDNRECNMRNCTPKQNNRNRRIGTNRSGLLGIHPAGKKWRAIIHKDGETVYDKVFTNKIQAARARDRKAVELFGEFASLNFPEEFEQTAGRQSEES